MLTLATAAVGIGVALTASTGMDVVAALALTCSVVLLGGYRLWRMGTGAQPGPETLSLQDPLMAELADELGIDLASECELATFTALQVTTIHLQAARLQISELDNPLQLVRAVRRLDLAVTQFVFCGEGLGALATAWALEQRAEQLARRVAAHRRPA